jgi:ADP-heptose:LPS heptosyltransferase
VVLAMPVAGALKAAFPNITIAFLGTKYTRAIAETCKHFDVFIDKEDFLNEEVLINHKKPECIIHLLTNIEVSKRAAELKIPLRVGSASRRYHWFTCNKLVWLKRKNSGLHEVQLNLKLLKPIGINKVFSYEEISALYGITKIENLKPEYEDLLKNDKFNIIIHPKSKGNSREWPLSHFIALINLLEEKYYNIILSGTTDEQKFLQEIIDAVNKPVNQICRISLSQFISLINKSDCIVCNSTGPLHIAAALGKNTIGIYPPLPTKNAERWGPVGYNTHVFELNKNCNACKKTPAFCACVNAINAIEIKRKIEEIAAIKMTGEKIRI